MAAEHGRGWSVALCVAMTLMNLMTFEAQYVLWTDEQAGTHINTISTNGIKLLIQWHDHFTWRMEAIKNVLDDAENTLGTEYANEVMPNVTAYVEGKLSEISVKLENATSKAEALNLNNTGDNLVAFMKTPSSTVNVGGHYDPNANSGNPTFTVPQYGLYQLMLRNLPAYGVSTNLIRNGNETILSLSNNNYYDVRTRIKLAFLNPGDQLWTTGDSPSYISIILLRVQTLMPDFLAE